MKLRVLATAYKDVRYKEDGSRGKATRYLRSEVFECDDEKAKQLLEREPLDGKEPSFVKANSKDDPFRDGNEEAADADAPEVPTNVVPPAKQPSVTVKPAAK